MVVVENEDKISKLEANLPAKASANCRNGTGSAPAAVREACDDKAATEAT